MELSAWALSSLWPSCLQASEIYPSSHITSRVIMPLPRCQAGSIADRTTTSALHMQPIRPAAFRTGAGVFVSRDLTELDLLPGQLYQVDASFCPIWSIPSP